MFYSKQILKAVFGLFLLSVSSQIFGQNTPVVEADTVRTGQLDADNAVIDQLQSVQLDATSVVSDAIETRSFQVEISEVQNVARIRGTLELVDGAVVTGEILSPHGIVAQGGIVFENLQDFSITDNHLGRGFLALDAQGNAVAYDFATFSRDLAEIISMDGGTFNLDNTPIIAQSISVTSMEVLGQARFLGDASVANDLVVTGQTNLQNTVLEGTMQLYNPNDYGLNAWLDRPAVLTVNDQGNVLATDAASLVTDQLDLDTIETESITTQRLSVTGPAILNQVTNFRGDVFLDGSNVFNGPTVFDAPVKMGSEVEIDTLLTVSQIAASGGDLKVLTDATFDGDLSVSGTTFIRDLREVDFANISSEPPVMVGVDRSGELRTINFNQLTESLAETLIPTLRAVEETVEGIGEGGLPGLPGSDPVSDCCQPYPHLPDESEDVMYYNRDGQTYRNPNSWYSNGAESIFTSRFWNEAKVGIRNQNPEYALDVNGNTRIERNLAVGNFTNVNGGPGWQNFDLDAYQLQVRGKIRLAPEWGVSGTNDAGERYELTNSGEQSHLYLGDNHHYLARRIYYEGQPGFGVKSGVYLKSYRNHGIFLRENGGGVGIGFDPTDPTAEETPTAMLHIKESEYTRDLPYFHIVDENHTDVLLIDQEKRMYAVDITVQEPNFPDYVFEEEYQLMTLEDTESYIQQNKRLPNMPSAAQVAKEGMDVGEVTKLLVEKVEELTLHLIELKKENEVLKEKVEKLNSK